ncbi:MAG TPA: DUF3592 domain-containing protein [Ktedonobacteraceae bacterium]
MLFLLFSLIFLVAGSIPTLINVQGVQARFSGMQTSALVRATGECDDGNYYSFIFADRTGKVYSIETATCSSGIVSDGDHVTVWYNPADPTQFISANDLTFDMFFLIGFSIPLLIALALGLVWLVRLLFPRKMSGVPSGYPYAGRHSRD